MAKDKEKSAKKRAREAVEAPKFTPASTIMRLNVGGKSFTTSLATLRSVPDSLLGRMFEEDSRFGTPLKDESGAVFLDRDPDVFKWLLDCLRRGGRFVATPGPLMLTLLKDELDYFGLHGLLKQIGLWEKEMAKKEEDELDKKKCWSGDTFQPIVDEICALKEILMETNSGLCEYDITQQEIFESINKLATRIYNPAGGGDLAGALNRQRPEGFSNFLGGADSPKD